MHLMVETSAKRRGAEHADGEVEQVWDGGGDMPEARLVVGGGMELFSRCSKKLNRFTRIA